MNLKRLAVSLVISTLLALLVYPARAEIATEAEYGVCLTLPADRFGGSVAFDGIAESAFTAHNNHWHFDYIPEGERPGAGDCGKGVFIRTVDEYGEHHQAVKFAKTDMDTAMRQDTYKFGYCDGDDQFCGQNKRSSSGSTRNKDKGGSE